MPTGKVRFFDEDRGFGFIVGEEREEVYMHVSVLDNPAEIYPGARVEYSVAEGRRGLQALSVKVLDQPRLVRRARKSADDMAIIVEDLVKLLDATGNRLKQGHYPERGHSRKLAAMLRSVAEDFDA